MVYVKTFSSLFVALVEYGFKNTVHSGKIFQYHNGTNLCRVRDLAEPSRVFDFQFLFPKGGDIFQGLFLQLHYRAACSTALQVGQGLGPPASEHVQRSPLQLGPSESQVSRQCWVFTAFQ